MCSPGVRTLIHDITACANACASEGVQFTARERRGQFLRVYTLHAHRGGDDVRVC